ncbi:MAG: hypothetical protein ACREAA_11930 [Candidatus Polarisedimenticolia bacterium]
MIVWDGVGGSTGDRYDPLTDEWTPISLQGAPGRDGTWDLSVAVWTGREMIVWNGSEGGRYDPSGDRWRPSSGRAACIGR